MPAGLQVKGTHGLFQIDEQSICMSVAAYGTLSSATFLSDPLFGADLYRISYTGSNPTFGLYLPSSQNQIGGVFATTKSGSTWTVDFLIEGPSSSRNLAEIRWFAFDKPPPPPSTGAGLLVYNLSGDLVYNSYYPIKVPSRSFISGRKYAGIGGTVGIATDLRVEAWTDMSIHFEEAYYAYGFNCPDGGLTEDNRLFFFQVGSGSGGGSTGFNQYGVNQPLLGIDITEYV